LTAAWQSNPNTPATAEDALAFFNARRGAVDIAPSTPIETDEAAPAEFR